jgi:hypothetical protein
MKKTPKKIKIGFKPGKPNFLSKPNRVYNCDPFDIPIGELFGMKSPRKKTKKKPLGKRALKKKLWSVTYADKKFREFILQRDQGCQRCHRNKPERLEVSHFWARRISSTRWYPENCILLHYSCHWGNIKGWEYEKQGVYRDYMIRWLGEHEYSQLTERAHNSMKRREAIQELMNFLHQ